ncbi:phage upper tail fiber protein [Lachnoclostridium phytofermentans]|uniref:Minor tail protein gp31 C-terminal domain-containing protein n=1 Tax=Lachnoclostridium phytofermentans (strain ATCC 700394 / DSM 18823 / ISDg) TaxID=357809 RepID=A9KPN1_LACP7|nr:hypothetical protein [Lachnoclostridium phytofermentans]ABX43305.1 hypothetical protein Cphy_2948 [Lachnoclostridium phytofermentans ISDg]
MAKYTEKLNLKKPEPTDFYNIKDFNDNMDKIEEHKHKASDITDLPESLPANGGNADTVNNHTVKSDVPSNAKFTDTVYAHPETHDAKMITGLPEKLPANGGNAHTVDDLHFLVLTQAAYDALSTKDANTIYFTT